MTEPVLTTIATFTFPYEAQIAKAHLDSEGIPAFVADEHTINMQWLYSNAMGGVRLQVPTIEAERAKAILQIDLSHLVDAETDSVDDDTCAVCKSKNIIAYTEGKKPAFLLFLLLGFPFFFYKQGVKCNDCGQFTAL